MRTIEDEIVPSTEHEIAKAEEEEEEQGDANGGEVNRTNSIQATANCRQKRSFRNGFSKLIASKRRKKNNNNKEQKKSDDDLPVRSRYHQISSCLLPPCCSSRPQTLPPDSPLSRPALQSLIEKNDFYSAECNVHRHLSFRTGGD